MMNGLFEPFWTVCPEGYQWQQQNKKQGQWLLHEKRPRNESECLPIRFSHLRPGLFMDFAKLKPLPDEILRFANQFGLLVGDKKKLSVGTVHTDRLKIWQHEIVTMRYVIAVWTALQENDDDGLAAYIRWKTNPPAAFFHAPESGDDPRPECYEIVDRDTLSERYGTAKPDQNCVLPAMCFVTNTINAKLTIAPQLYALTPADRLEDDFRLGLQPSQCNLLQALWLQAAQYIESGKRFRKCSICEKWFVVASKASLTRCEYCSDACKVKAFRHRQDDARQRFARGETIEDIAKVYGSDPKVVTGWITGRKPD